MTHPRSVAALLLAIAGCGSSPPPSPGPASVPPAPGAAAPEASAPAPPTPPGLRLPGDVRPLRYALDLTIIPDQPTLTGRVHVDAEVVRPTRVVWLNATGLTVSRAQVGGRDARVVPGGDDAIGLAVDVELAPGPIALDLDYQAPIDPDRSHGVYAQREGAGADAYAYTFFEPIDARRAFPCFDEPAYKVPWQLTFHVKADHVALANAAVVSETPEAGGMKRVVTAETAPLPSYLVAFVVGPFEIVDGGTAGRAATPIRFVIPKGRAAELRYARAITPKVVTALEDYFDMPYPYGKLDVAVVPRYWGTMEHPGLVAMGQPLTLIKPAEETRGRKQAYANILAHELAHYWFGDYVTMAWWNDTWLNEAQAEWLDAIITDAADPSWEFLDVRAGRAAGAMAVDELLATRSIRQDVTTKEGIQASFDNAITYDKGATVVQMFAAWLGEDRWRAFIRGYVRKFAWKHATAEDFLGVMGDALGAGTATAFRSFLEQPGVPLIEHELVCEGKPRLILHQRRSLPVGVTEPTARTWQIPVCVRYGAGTTAHRTCTLLTAADGELPLAGGCPTWLLMNADGVGYYRSRYREAEASRLTGRAAPKTNVRERLVLLADLGAAVGRDELDLGAAMAMVPRFAADRDERIVAAARGLESSLDSDVLDDDDRARYRRWLLRTWGVRARQLGWQRRPGDSDDRHDLRRGVLAAVGWAGDRKVIAESRRLALAWLADRTAVADDLAGTVLTLAAYHGDAALFERYLVAARAAGDRREQRRLLAALARFRDPALVARALALVLDATLDGRETRAILYGALGMRESRELAWQFVETHLDALLGGMRGDEAAGFIGFAAGVFCEPALRDRAAALLTPRARAIDGAQHALAQGLEEAGQCIATQARIGPSARRFLARY